MISLTINNNPVEVSEGTTILDAAKLCGMRIPTLCYVEGLKAVGACRVCVVEVEGARNLIASCSMPATEGMKVLTNTRRVRESRRTVVELLLSEHNGECRPANGTRTANCRHWQRSWGFARSPTSARRPAGGSILPRPP
ncbi:MAG: (2Fe-2S)-binding protein [Pirellulales bacterium]|nr:(2Fe-2S)-binding protein [Pirellulales bacterium]